MAADGRWPLLYWPMISALPVGSLGITIIVCGRAPTALGEARDKALYALPRND